MIQTLEWLRSRARSYAKNQGFTLIEIMVAVLMLFAAMAGIVPFFLSGLTQASTVRYKSIASNIARERMEEIRQLDYREITEVTAEGETLTDRFGNSATYRGIAFAIDYDVEASTYEQGTLKKVTVNVSWTAPPKVSAAAITTLIHQQFLGPRGALLELAPTYSDPLGTPFPWIRNNTEVRYHLAEADWSLVFGDVSQPATSVRPVYARFMFFNDDGGSVPLGDQEDDFRISTDYLTWSLDGSGQLDDVWFEYDFDAGTIPDGYWELRAVAYNQYDQPGNVWRLRVRVENGAPAMPVDFTAVPSEDNQTITLFWSGGPEFDRDRYILERSKWDPLLNKWTDWAVLSDAIGPKEVTYVDQGSVDAQIDPWGDPAPGMQNSYLYRIHAVDKCEPGLEGQPAELEDPVVLPPVTTTTTTLLETTTTLSTSTTTTSSTTTTVVESTVNIKNNSKSHYDIVIKDAGNNTVFTGTVNKGKTLTTSPLPAGSYQIYATPKGGGTTVTSSFSLPSQAGQTVLTLL